MRRDRDVLAGSLLALVAASCFGTLGPLSRYAADAGVGELGFVAWRAAIGATILGLGLAASGRGFGSLRHLDRSGRLALALAVAMGATLNIAIFMAFGRITIALALVLFYTYPAMVAVVGIALGHEPPSVARLAALAFATGGVGLVLAGGLDPADGVSVDVLGVALALAAAGCQTVFVTVSRHHYHAVPADVATLVILCGGSLATIAVALVGGVGGQLAGPFTAPSAWPFVLLAGAVGAALPSSLFLSAIRRIGGVRTGILMLSEPVVGAALAAALLAEPLRPIQVAGGALVLAAATLVQLGARPELAVPEDSAPVA